jgi:hypothetical protein
MSPDKSALSAAAAWACPSGQDRQNAAMELVGVIRYLRREGHLDGLTVGLEPIDALLARFPGSD